MCGFMLTPVIIVLLGICLVLSYWISYKIHGMGDGIGTALNMSLEAAGASRSSHFI